MKTSIRLNHGSTYARDPKRVAEHLAALTGGTVQPFHPLEGAWVCLLGEDWSGPLIEFYPRTATLAHDQGQVQFRPLERGAEGGGTHFNLSVPRSRATLERTCLERGLAYTWRDWAGFLDVWLEEDLLIECVPEPGTKS
jgi:hypothetical protein